VADDIVTRLRCNPVDCDGKCWNCLAADEIERLRAVLDAIDALHRGLYYCCECDYEWPCPTHLLIHPMTLDEAINTLGTVHK